MNETDGTYYKFFVARKMNIEKANEMITTWYNWKQKTRVDLLKRE